MVNSSAFVLINNDGKQDRMLNATQLLSGRILMIREIRTRQGLRDVFPTIAELEKTHVFFMYAHFKPFAAMAYEYHRVRPSSGTQKLGQEVQFNIPHYGDFINDMVVHIRLGAVGAINAGYWTQTASSANAAKGSELVRYINNPGLRIFDKVRFLVNSNELDSYDSTVAVMHDKFLITPARKTAWNNMNGQQTCAKGTYSGVPGEEFRTQAEIVHGIQVPKAMQEEVDLWIPLLFWFNKSPDQAIPSISLPHSGRQISIKLARPDQLLQHVHATDPSLSNPSLNPVQAPEIETCALYINNIFVNTDVHEIFIHRIGFSLIRVYRLQANRLQKQSGEESFSNLKWPIETIYLGFIPTDNTENTNPYMAEDWNQFNVVSRETVPDHRLQDYAQLVRGFPAVAPTHTDAIESALTGNAPGSPTIVTAAGEVIPTPATFYGYVGVLNSTNFPMFVGGQALDAVGLINYWSARFGLPQMNRASFANPNAPTAAELNAAWRCPRGVAEDPATPGSVVVVGSSAQSGTITYTTHSPLVERFDVTAHSIQINEHETPASFYHDYIPYTYGHKGGVCTPKDIGMYVINFCLFMNQHQPSGHFNLSRSREFFIKYYSNIINNNFNAMLVLVAIGINFLLISDGSATIRYVT